MSDVAPPTPREIAEALFEGMRWTAKFIADRKVEGVEDNVVDAAERSLRKITSAMHRYKAAAQ